MLIKLKKTLSIALHVCLLLISISAKVNGQVTFFSEDVGSPSATTPVATYTGWQNSSPIVFSGSADVRITTPSTGYSGASGSGNVFITNTIGIQLTISGINTTAYTGLSLSLGHFKSTTASSNELVIEVSSDGVTFTPLTYSRPTGTGTAVWTLINPTGSIPSTPNLVIRFRQTSTTPQFRIDDIKLSGTLNPCSVSITSFSPTSGPVGTLVTIVGNNFSGATEVRFNGIPQTTFSIISPTLITARVPPGATTGPISVFNSCNGISPTVFSVISSSCPYGGTGLILSELCDPYNNYQTDRFIEIFNPTNSTVNINGWQVRAIANGNITAVCTDPSVLCWNLTGSILPGQALTCGYTSPTAGGPHDFTSIEWITTNPTNLACFNWNGQYQDGAALYDNNNVRIDAILRGSFTTSWYADRSLVRKSTICGPNPSSPATDWTTTSTVNSAGSAPATPRSHISDCVGNTPDIDVQPSSMMVCEGTSVTFSVVASGGTPPYQYAWKVFSGSGIWQTVSNGGYYSGATTADLTISNVPIGFNNYQFYCEVYNNGLICYKASNAVQLTVNTSLVPTFTQIGPLCQNSTAPPLPGSSTNTPPISGTWNPATINTSIAGTTIYTFTPTPVSGQCANTITMAITIIAQVIPVFNQIGPLCQNSTPPVLPIVSTNGITGSWSPSTISTGTPGSFLFTFTPDAGQCGSQVPMTVIITPAVLPSVTITANPGNTICSDQSVTFTATPTNGGITPSYQWKKNGTDVGANNPMYTDPALADGDQIKVVMTSNAVCTTTASVSSNTITMTVTPAVTPSVIITASPGTTVCSGQSVTFTAVPANGGSNPSYQWKKNGGNVGANSDTYTDASPATGDQIQVLLTSNAVCATPATASSNVITMTVTTALVPSVSIEASPGSTICTGENVTFTAIPVNGGDTPSYQWKKNGSNVGVNSATYADASLVSGDQIQVVMTSNSACASPSSASSNVITMTVTSTLVPAVSIDASPGTTICTGENVTFTATPVNGGSAPSYQWKKNGGNVGVNSAIYADATLATGDQIQVVMTSNSACASPSSAASNTIFMTVTSALVPLVSIEASPGSTICSGEMVSFTAIPVNGGAAPSYQWKINGTNAGTNSPMFAVASLVTGDQIQVTMTSSSSCASPPSVTSNAITMTVTSAVTPSVSIDPDQNPVCQGAMVLFTASPVYGGTPLYAWYKNNVLVSGEISSTFSLIPSNGDRVKSVMTSSYSCATVNPVTSNEVTMTISASLPAGISILPDQNPVCFGYPVTLTASPVNGGTPVYSWYKNSVIVAGETAATYTLIPVDGDKVKCVMTSSLTGCVTGNPATSNEVTLTVSNSLQAGVSILADQNPVCQGTLVTFTATPVNGGNPSYSWVKNGFTVPGENGVSYSYAPADGDSIYCFMTSSIGNCVTGNPARSNAIVILVSASLESAINITANPNTICSGNEVIFRAHTTNPGSDPILEWFVNGASVQIDSSAEYVTMNYQAGQEVSCKMTSSLTCVAPNPVMSLPVTVGVQPSPVVKLTNEDYLCSGIATRLDAGSGFSAYLWQDGSTDQFFTATDKGKYFVMVTDSVGCSGSDTVLFKQCTQNFYAPTAFSPNGDNINDLFLLKGNIDEMTSFTLSIFSRWGELMFETDEIAKGWDGNHKGKPSPQDTYAWIVKYQVSSASPGSKPITLKGTFTLVR